MRLIEPNLGQSWTFKFGLSWMRTRLHQFREWRHLRILLNEFRLLHLFKKRLRSTLVRLAIRPWFLLQIEKDYCSSNMSASRRIGNALCLKHSLRPIWCRRIHRSGQVVEPSRFELTTRWQTHRAPGLSASIWFDWHLPLARLVYWM